MNPSASGWINKLLTTLPKNQILEQDTLIFYQALKNTGFTYGSNVSCLCTSIDYKDFNEEERCKVNLLSAFYNIHLNSNSNENFINSVVAYYKNTIEKKRSIILNVFGEPEADKLLEKIIHKRIHIEDNIVSKTFSYFLINVFLFIDVLGYKHFLQNQSDTKTYINNFESVLEQIIFKVLEAKAEKTEYDYNLVKLFASSSKHKNSIKTDITSDITSTITSNLEKLYIMDIVCMAAWSDRQIDKEEYLYINQLLIAFNIENKLFKQSITDINTFYDTNKNNIAFLSSKNLAKSFYKNSSKFVKRLIKRNSKRILIELFESKEAMILLSQSTKRSLTEEEQKQVQNQLIDIFKSIPSLAIFMLPGGMILMPLFIKFIPTLLPSAFDENRINEIKQDKLKP